MVRPEDVHSLTDFQRNAKGFLRRLKRNGRPELLTINGKAAVVVQDAASYTAMLDELYRAYVVEAGRVGIEQMKAGQGIPFEQVAKELRSKYGRSAGKKRSA